MGDREQEIRSRRDRPAKPALTRQGIVDAAVRVMHAEGLDKVTMRRLATELDTGAASLYVYVRDAAELRAAVLDELLADVDLHPIAAEGDWQNRMRLVLRSYLGVLLAHPPLARSALLTRPSGPRYLDLIEALLALLHQAGIDDRRASWAVDLLMQSATATGAEHTSEGEDPDAAAGQFNALVAAVDNAPPDRYPRVTALGRELFTGTGQDRVDWAFDVLLNGILATPRTDPQT
ncbi:AcrR family transcriptional regulator [Nocardia sp. GAS34]|uniref:TetR/AcrR family transcriptional regulator n=1 Tax=unclassified Nocardia TaxID=2637762 RepID=UPI003D225499